MLGAWAASKMAFTQSPPLETGQTDGLQTWGLREAEDLPRAHSEGEPGIGGSTRLLSLGFSLPVRLCVCGLWVCTSGWVQVYVVCTCMGVHACGCVCTCACVGMYICGCVDICGCMDICVWVCVHVWVCTFVRMCACVHLWVCTFVCGCMHVCAFVGVGRRVCMCGCACVGMYIHVWICVRMWGCPYVRGCVCMCLCGCACVGIYILVRICVHVGVSLPVCMHESARIAIWV